MQHPEDIRQLGRGTLWSLAVSCEHIFVFNVRLDDVKQLLTAGCLLDFRGERLHKGVDIECSDGSDVLAPFDVTIKGSLIVYNDPNKKAIDEGINLSGEGQSTAHLVTDCVIDPGFDLMTEWLCLCPAGLCFKLFYVKPIKTSGTVDKGEKIGTMLPMQSVYQGITSHIHVQMCNRSEDPTEYFSDLCQTHVPSEETELIPGRFWWFDLPHYYA